MTTLAPARLRTRTGLALGDYRRREVRLANLVAGRPGDLTVDQRRDIGIAADLDVDRLVGDDMWHRHYGLEVGR